MPGHESLVHFFLNYPERWAGALLLLSSAALLLLWWKRRRLADLLRPLSPFDLPTASEGRWFSLFAASFATLFFELLLIRWIAVEVR